MNEKYPLRLRKRAEFLAVRGGLKFKGPLILLEVRKQQEKQNSTLENSIINTQSDIAPPRIGFTVSKKNGNAVKRNRIRRRLREAVREIAKDHLKPGADYVIVARPDCLTASYDRLKDELKRRFDKV